jgi:flagellar hook-associated protein 2
MANAIDGVGTINVSSLVSSLMSVEGGQQTLLTSQRTTEQTRLSALQGLNTQVAAIRTAAESIMGSALAPRAWVNRSATSSSSTVAASAVSTTPADGSLTFDVVSTAAAHRVLLGTAVSASDAVGGGSLVITRADGTSTSLDLSGASNLTDVVNAINASSSAGVRATAIQVAPGSFRLSLAAPETGAAGAFTVTGLESTLGAATTVAQGTDAVLRIGTAETDTVRSSSNTFTDLLPGLSVTVSKPEQGVTVSVGRDVTAMVGQVQTLVNAMNKALGTVDAQSSWDAATKKGGPLLGEASASRVADALTGSLLADVRTLSPLGIGIDRNGSLTFDATKLAAALRSTPDSTAAAITSFATRAGLTAKDATQTVGGWLTGAVKNRQARITSLSTRITDWDTRLAARKTELTRIYSKLNTELTTMNDQKSWLTSQIASLSSTG